VILNGVFGDVQLAEMTLVEVPRSTNVATSPSRGLRPCADSLSGGVLLASASSMTTVMPCSPDAPLRREAWTVSHCLVRAWTRVVGLDPGAELPSSIARSAAAAA
jgi:hypothetical protein